MRTREKGEGPQGKTKKPITLPTSDGVGMGVGREGSEEGEDRRTLEGAMFWMTNEGGRRENDDGRMK